MQTTIIMSYTPHNVVVSKNTAIIDPSVNDREGWPIANSMTTYYQHQSPNKGNKITNIRHFDRFHIPLEILMQAHPLRSIFYIVM